MPISHVITKQLVRGADAFSAVVTKTAGASQSIAESVPDGATGQPIAMTLDVSQVVSIWVMATGGDLTLKTNSSSTPDDTLTLTDGVPHLWSNDDVEAVFLTADVTALYATNASGSTVALSVEVLLDPTA